MVVEDDWFVLNAMVNCDCEAYLWLYMDVNNGTFDAAVRERWNNGKYLRKFPFSSVSSLGLWCVGCGIGVFCLKLLQEFGVSVIRSSELREKRRAREQAAAFRAGQ